MLESVFQLIGVVFFVAAAITGGAVAFRVLLRLVPPPAPPAPIGNPPCVELAKAAEADPAAPAIEEPTSLRCSMCMSSAAVVSGEDFRRIVRDGSPVYCEHCLGTVLAHHKAQEGK